MTRYQFLAECVKDAAHLPEPLGWKKHREQLAQIKIKTLAGNTVANDREEAGER